MANFYDRIGENNRNTYILVFAVLIIVFAMVWSLSFILFGDDLIGYVAGAVLAGAYVAITYFFSSRIMLAVSGAREARKDEFPYLVNVVEGLSIAAGIPVPKIYVIDDAGMNAFATGLSPDKASVAFTTGLLGKMNRTELEGVAAHELSHIKNYDSRLATVAAVMVGLIAILSNVGLRSMFWRGRVGGGRRDGGGAIAIIAIIIAVLAPIAAYLVRLMLSRQREFLADATGAQLTRYPEGLASALEKIKSEGSMVQHATEATASLYFANPLSMSGLLSTHPPIDERIRRLREM